MREILIGSAFIYGTLLASFLTLVGYRVPLNVSIVNPPSHCSNCKKRLTLIDLVPILSYLWNRGKCRHCKTRYGSFHVWTEIFIGLLFVYGFIAYEDNLILYPAFLMLVMLVNILYVSSFVHESFLKKTSFIMSLLTVLYVSSVSFGDVYVYGFLFLLINSTFLYIKNKWVRMSILLLSITLIITYTFSGFILGIS